MRIADFKVPLVCGFLIAAVLVVYGQTIGHGFVNFDDNDYVYENPHVLAGLRGREVEWALSSREVSLQWQPLTLLSLMADAELSRRLGAGDIAQLAAWMHTVNVVLHAANVLLLFLLLRDMSGAMWRSAAVAAIFAVHPAHVESVAWITERKDVLCGLFGLVSIWAYSWYALRPSAVRYLAVAGTLALGLMCKPMLVTWPALFLLLDYWPLGRLTSGSRGLWACLEKLPLVMLAVGSSAISFLTQQSGGQLTSLETTPIVARIARAAVLYTRYAGETLWPANLAAVYPDTAVGNGKAALAAVGLALATAGAVWGARLGKRWLAVGWFWYLGTLLPVTGLIQTGTEVMADRFLYLPQIGLTIAAVWWGAEAALWRPKHHGRIAAAVALVLAAWTVCAWQLAACWRTSESLWTNNLAKTSRNWIAEYNFANTLKDSGRPADAIPHYHRAIAIHADFIPAYTNLGLALAACYRFDEAMAVYNEALRIKPDSVTAYCNRGTVLASRGQYVAAIADYRKALEFEPRDATVRRNLAIALGEQGEADAAIAEYEKALAIDPNNPSLYYRLGVELDGRGRRAEALDWYTKGLAAATTQRKTEMAEAIGARIAGLGGAAP